MPPHKHSRYQFSLAMQNVDGKWFLTRPEPFRHHAYADNILHEASEGDTWWSIAEKYYGDDGWKFWKFVMDYQEEPVSDPTVKISSGSTVVVPSRRVLYQEIMNTDRRRLA